MYVCLHKLPFFHKTTSFTPSQSSSISTISRTSKKRTPKESPNSSPNSETSPNSSSGRPQRKHSRVVSISSSSSTETTTPYQSPSKIMDEDDRSGEETLLLPETIEEFDALPPNTRKAMYKMMRDFQKQNAKLEQRLMRLESNFNHSNGQQIPIQTTNSELKEKARLFAQMSEYETEKKAKEGKKNNLVLYGLPEKEGADSKDHDKQVLQELFKMSEISVPFDDCVVEFFRMGKQGKSIQKNGQDIQCPRLLKLKLKSFDTKKRLLKAQRQAFEKVSELHGQPFSQYFRDDLTFMQRVNYGELVKERNRKNAALKPGDGRWKIMNNETLVQERKQEN